MTARAKRKLWRSGRAVAAGLVVLAGLGVFWGPVGLAADGNGRTDRPGQGGTVWETVRDGALDAVSYSATVLRQMASWLADLGPGGGDKIDAAELRALISLPEKNFREFESLIAAAGFRLTGLGLGTGEPAELDLSFAFVRRPGDKDRAMLRDAISARRGGLASSLWRTVLVALLDATRYVDAIPASGYRLEGVSMQIGATSSVKVNFRRAGG